MPKSASKEDILGLRPKVEQIEVPGTDLVVSVRGMRGFERDAFESSMFVEGEEGKRMVDTKNLRARLVSLCVVDEKGDRLFSEAEAESLGAIDAAALDALYTAAQRLSGIGPKAEEDARKPSPDQS